MDGNIYEKTYEKIGVSIDGKKLESVLKNSTNTVVDIISIILEV